MKAICLNLFYFTHMYFKKEIKVKIAPSYIQANGMVLEAKLSPMKVFYKVLFEKFKKNVGLTLNQKISLNLD